MSTLLKLVMAMALPCMALSCVESELSFASDNQDQFDEDSEAEILTTVHTSMWTELSVPSLQKGVATTTPWPGTHWPMQRDGFNKRWQGNTKLSPMEAYDRAFNDWVPDMGFEAFTKLRKYSYPQVAYSEEYYDELGPAATWAHETGGSYRDREHNDPDGSGDGAASELESWFGHCHAWAGAAISVAEPQRAVTMNGVRFEVSDIKALLLALYDDADELFLGGRCDLKVVESDEYGRIVEDKCRNTNPGTFHLVVLNRLGIDGLSFVMDKSAGRAVWNHPVIGYSVETQDEISEEEALVLLNREDTDTYPYNPNALNFVHVKMKLDYLSESSASTSPMLRYVNNYTSSASYQYVLELGKGGAIVGGEWLPGYTGPDFLWTPVGARDVDYGFWKSTVIERDIVADLHARSL